MVDFLQHFFQRDAVNVSKKRSILSPINWYCATCFAVLVTFAKFTPAFAVASFVVICFLIVTVVGLIIYLVLKHPEYLWSEWLLNQSQQRQQVLASKHGYTTEEEAQAIEPTEMFAIGQEGVAANAEATHD